MAVILACCLSYAGCTEYYLLLQEIAVKLIRRYSATLYYGKVCQTSLYLSPSSTTFSFYNREDILKCWCLSLPKPCPAEQEQRHRALPLPSLLYFPALEVQGQGLTSCFCQLSLIKGVHHHAANMKEIEMQDPAGVCIRVLSYTLLQSCASHAAQLMTASG